MCIPTLCHAGPVTQERAARVAANFFSVNGRSSSVVEERVPATKADGSRPYYIFNNSGDGFVIVAGDDAASPVLAYSMTGSFSLADAPYFITDWLDAIRHDVEDAVVTDAVSSKWKMLENKVATKAGQGQVVLQTAQWGQRAPFNDQCPGVQGKKTLTGCTATATAIIMRYHKWPDSGIGRLPDYYADGIYCQGHYLGHTYDWDKMPLSSSGFTTAEAFAISQLMHDVGVMCKMDYGTEASSASTWDAVVGLVKYMRYYDGITRYVPADSDHQEFMRVCQNEIDNSRPILISAKSKDSGHAFVIDGYDPSGFVHINWGWTGMYNGFFKFPEFREYTSNHFLYIGIEKSLSNNRVLMYNSFGCTMQSERTGHAEVVIYNNSLNSSYKGDVAVARFDARGNLMEIVSDAKSVEVSVDSKQSMEFNCSLSSNPLLGEYLSPVHRAEGESDWKTVYYEGVEEYPEQFPLHGNDELEAITSITYEIENDRLVIESHPDARVFIKEGGSDEYEVTGPVGLERYHNKIVKIVIKLGANILKMEVVS